ncbi:hypothetical protein HPB49_007068 [Dermacentor silvarum]|uniref:Uncharacterized protein n=1 Tax=Dermacentor silvarum TaxID=543639 RepID=A0ACB8D3S4_DERSI|nr:hypothetical protein HPB49_007068 [Dermacentor silvarum]
MVEAVMAVETQADAQVMEVESGASAKRPRDEAGNEVEKPIASSGDEPPTKTVMKAGLQTGRRMSFKPKPTGQHVDEAVDTEQQEQVEGTVAMPNREEESPPDPGAASTPPEHEDMDTHTGLANLQAGKRPRDQTNSLATTQDSSGGDEPPPKAPAQPSTPSSCPEGERNKQQVAVTSKDRHEPAKGVDSASTGRDAPPDMQPPVSVTESVEECMDVSRDGASSMAGKRAHERTVDSEQQRDDGGGGEPPTKTPVQTSDGKGKEETAIELATPGASTAEHGPATAMMDVADPSANCAATKRARDVTSTQEDDLDNETQDEPPQKTQASRRASIRPKPNIPPDRRTAAEPPT